MRDAGPVTKGRIVRYFAKDGSTPRDGLVALICKVSGGAVCNLLVFDEEGFGTAQAAVPKYGTDPDARHYWDWSQRVNPAPGHEDPRPPRHNPDADHQDDERTGGIPGQHGYNPRY